MQHLQEAELCFDDRCIQEIDKDDKNLIALIRDKTAITVINKVDLPVEVDENEIEQLVPTERIIRTSALKQEGIEDLKTAIYDIVTEKMDFADEGLIAAGERQRKVMQEALNFLDRAIEAMADHMPIEMIELDIRDAWEKLGEITGDTVSEDIITTIFQKFCIGK